jgi:glycosyltransferase involved in cell wall biosynthesis
MTMLSVVIPAYNEEAAIEQIMTRVLSVRGALDRLGITDLELLVIDDGSRDRTSQIAREVGCRSQGVRVVSHLKNKGYGAALKTGFCLSRGELIGFLDADGTYPPEYFPQLCQAALKGADLVVGTRMAGAASKMPLTRQIGNVFFATLLSMLGNRRVTDSASGMRVFARSVLDHLYPLPDGLNLTPVMSARALHENVSMAEVPIPYSERTGRSKLSVFRDGSVFLQSILWTVLAYNPVRILGAIGLIAIGLACLIGLGLVITRLTGVTHLDYCGVAALFAGLVCAVCGISIFSLGATFNYLVSLFYKEPIRQGLFGKPLFNPPLDRYFGWIGATGLMVGLLSGVIALGFSIGGWDISRIWLYLLGSAMLILVGFQLIIYWILMRVLEQLSQRDALTKNDMNVQVLEYK